MAPKTDTYDFRIRYNEGFTLDIDGITCEGYNYSGTRTVYQQVSLVANMPTPFELKWFETWGDAVIELHWSTPTMPEEIVPSSAFLTFIKDQMAHQVEIFPTSVPA